VICCIEVTRLPFIDSDLLYRGDETALYRQ
jgi:hypothetical protein